VREADEGEVHEEEEQVGAMEAHEAAGKGVGEEEVQEGETGDDMMAEEPV